MFTDEPFIIFGSDHLVALGLIFISIIIIPYLVLTLKEKTQNVISTSLALLILLNEFSKPVYYPALYPDYFSVLKILPLHFCHLSAICAAIFLLLRKKIFFEISFFWGIAGGLIANTQPRY
jgi:Predicted integral membrane protein